MKTALATDAQYLAAVKSGDTAKAQQMVDEAAKAAGVNRKIDPTKIRTFWRVGKPPEGGKSYNTKDQFFEKGVSTYFYPEATSFAGMDRSDWYKVSGEFVGYGSDGEPLVKVESFKKGTQREIDAALKKKPILRLEPGDSFHFPKYITYDDRFTVRSVLRRKNGSFYGYEISSSYIAKDYPIGTEIPYYRKFGPEYLADDELGVTDITYAPITYNKQGEMVPLSQRFNSSSEEITNPVVPENEGIPFFHTTTKITKLEDVDISKTSPNSYLGQALYGVLEGGSWKPSHLKSGRILRGTVSGRIIDLSNVTNEDLKRIGQLIGRNIETVPFLTLEKRYGDIGKGLRAAGYSAAIHLGPANTGKHIAIFDVSKIKSIGVDEITNPAGRIPAQFPYEYASYLKQHFPEIWRLGGNIRGNDAFRWWTAYRQGDRSPTVMHWWTVTRPAWIARHYRDHLIAGVVAQIKWGTIGRLGVEGMKRVVETKIRNSR